jgi:hypothetical protein
MLTPRTRRRGISAVVAALAMTASLAGTAWAGGTGGWDDGGTGGTGGGTETGGTGASGYTCGQAIGKTDGALYQMQDGVWIRVYESPYPNCSTDPGGWLKTGLAQVCQDGFDVYRFYGTVKDPVEAMTNSSVVMSDWCALNQTYFFQGTTPYDQSPNGSFGSPWSVVKGTNPTAADNNGPSVITQWAGTGLLTTGTPTKDLGTCSAVSTHATLLHQWDTATPADKVQFRAQIGNQWLSSSQQGKYVTVGDEQVGVTSLGGYHYDTATWNPASGVAPVRDDSGTGFYASSFTFDDRPCATPWDFVSTTDQSAAVQPVYGTCYIPTMRMRYQMSKGGQLAWAYPALNHGGSNTGEGERLSVAYAGQADTQNTTIADPDAGIIANVTAGQLKTIKNTWRAAMVNNYTSLSAHPLDANGDQLLPANQYPSHPFDAAATINWAQGAATLGADARCRIGDQEQLPANGLVPVTPKPAPKPAPKPTPKPAPTTKPAPAPTTAPIPLPTQPAPPVPGTGLGLRVTDQRYYQVRADQYPQTITVTTGQLAAPSNGTILSLTYGTQVTGISSAGEQPYHVCAGTPSSHGNATGCDAYATPGTPTYGSNGLIATETLTLSFVHATQPGQQLLFQLTDPTVSYRYTVQVLVKKKLVTEYRYGTFAPAVVGSPVAVAPTGLNWDAEFPVIGAVLIPGDNS